MTSDIHELGVRYRADGQEQVKQANRDVATTGREAEQATNALSVAQTKRTGTDRGAAQGAQEVTRATMGTEQAVVGATRATMVMEQRTESATRATNAAAAANRNLAVSTNGASRAMQGFDMRGPLMQISQIAQQSTATGNVLQAVAIQAADIGLYFGAMGTVVGLAATVLLPLTANLWSNEEATKAAAKAQEDWQEGLADAESAIGRAEDALMMLSESGLSTMRDRFGEVTENVRELVQELADIESRAAAMEIGKILGDDMVSNFSDAFGDVAGVVAESMLDGGQEAIDAQLAMLAQAQTEFANARALGLPTEFYAQQVRELEQELAALEGRYSEMGDLADQLGPSPEQVLRVRELQEAYDDALRAEDFQAVADILNEMRATAEAAGIEIDQGVRERMVQAESIAREFAGRIGEAKTEAENFAAAIGTIDLTGVANGAAFLAQMMGMAADEAIRYNSALNQQAGIAATRTGLGFSGLSGSADDGSGLGVGQTRVGFGNLDNTPIRSVTPLPKATRAGRGGGAGSAAKDAAKELEKTTRAYESLMASLDPLIAAEQELAAAQETINDALKAGKITAEEAAVALALVSEEYKETLNDIADDETEERIGKIRDGMESLTETLLRTAIAGDSVGEALRNFLMDALIQSAAQNLASSLSGMFGGGGAGGGFLNFLFGGKNANGNAFSGGDVIAFADGGVVDSDTYFPMSGGRMGLMGEAGPEAIMPLSRGSDGKLGVKTQGGGSQSVSMPIHVDARGAQVGVAEQIVQALQAALPQFTASAVNAVYSKNRESQLR